MAAGRVWRVGAYVTSFVLGRGVLFGAPLVLANVLVRPDYGLLETAHALASVSANVAALGTVGLVPLVLLGHAQRTGLAAIVVHHLVLAGLCLLVALAGWSGDAAGPWAPAALLTAAVLLQSLGSTHLKTLGRGEASVLLDAGLFGLMAAAGWLAHLLDRGQEARWVWAAAGAYAAGLLLLYLRRLPAQLRQPPAGLAAAWRVALRLGMPLMLGGMVSLLATTSGRLGMGLLAGPLVAADYAVLSRAAALPIVAHQLVLIARFRHLFTLPHDAVERAAAQIVLLVAASGLGFWLLSAWSGKLLGPAFVAAWDAHRLPGRWIVAQAVLWSAISLNDLIISRHHIMSRVLPATAGFVALAMLAGLWWLHRVGPTLANFVQMHGVLMLLFYAVQSAAMHALGVRLWRVWLCAAGAFVAMFAAGPLLP